MTTTSRSPAVVGSANGRRDGAAGGQFFRNVIVPEDFSVTDSVSPSIANDAASWSAVVYAVSCEPGQAIFVAVSDSMLSFDSFAVYAPDRELQSVVLLTFPSAPNLITNFAGSWGATFLPFARVFVHCQDVPARDGAFFRPSNPPRNPFTE